MPPSQLGLIQQGLSNLMAIVDRHGLQSFSDPVKRELAEIFRLGNQRISELRIQNLGQIPQDIQQLWNLSGGDPNAFRRYLSSFPAPNLQQIANNPGEVDNLVTRLGENAPQNRTQTEGGVQRAPLQSSNIWGFNYNPMNQRMMVRFQGGRTYGYEGIPPQIFNLFKSGAIPARTTGRNRYGEWWRGKQPSLGATFFSLIKNGGFPYERLN